MSFQAYIDAVVAKTGKQPEELRELMEQAHIIERDMKARVFCDWLHEKYDLGHGHSMALWNLFIRNGWVVTKYSKIK